MDDSVGSLVSPDSVISESLRKRLTLFSSPSIVSEEIKQDTLHHSIVQPRYERGIRSVLVMSRRNVYWVESQSIRRFAQFCTTRLVGSQEGQDTIVEGELLQEKENVACPYCFCIYDVWLLQGQNVCFQPVSARIQELLNTIKTQHCFLISPLVCCLVAVCLPFPAFQTHFKKVQDTYWFQNRKCIQLLVHPRQHWKPIVETTSLEKWMPGLEPLAIQLIPLLTKWKSHSNWELEVQFKGINDAEQFQQLEQKCITWDTKGTRLSTEEIDYFHGFRRYTRNAISNEWSIVEKKLDTRFNWSGTREFQITLKSEVPQDKLRMMDEKDHPYSWVRMKKRNRYPVNTGADFEFHFTSVKSGSHFSKVAALKDPNSYEVEMEMIRTPANLSKKEAQLATAFIEALKKL